MFRSLRSRLMLSYIAVIGLTLCVVAGAVTVLILRGSLPARLAYQHLRDIGRASLPHITLQSAALDEQLGQVARTNDVRALRLQPNGSVLYDSSGAVAPGAALDLVALGSTAAGQYGSFRDAGVRWLYVALDTSATRANVGLIVLASPAPRAAQLSLLGNDLIPPLVEAGVIGLVISIVLAVLISASVARPLRRAADAAHAIAIGDHTRRAPEEGPREVQELAHAFNHMVDQVTRSQQTQRDFLANVSHELKTPLTSIQGYSQAILDGTAADPAPAAQVIYDEAGRMQRLVEDLLDLARVELGAAPLRREAIALAPLLDAVLATLSPQATQQGVRLLREDTATPRIIGDGDRLAQVFTNLISNAIQHTPDGGQVRISTATQGQEVEIVVSDTGPGIPAQDVARVFERFYRADKSRARSAQKGTGLGLTISKEIVEAHGGSIEAASTEGQGATFTVWLPLPRPSDETVSRRQGRP